jgi:hypothetical protein
LANVIETGQFPACQRGDYDMRLDREHDQRLWAALVEQTLGNEVVSAKGSQKTMMTGTMGKTQKEKDLSLQLRGDRVGIAPDNNQGQIEFSSHHSRTSKLINHVPLAVVLPIRNRAGQLLRNALHSLAWQSSGRPAQVLVVSFGSEPDINRELSALCEKRGAKLITVGDPNQSWNKPFALNVGIRAALPDVLYIMTMDADMILAPNFFNVVLDRLGREPPALVLCRSSDLPKRVNLPSSNQNLMDAFDNLRTKSRLRFRTGTGGIQAAKRSFFFDIREARLAT